MCAFAYLLRHLRPTVVELSFVVRFLLGDERAWCGNTYNPPEKGTPLKHVTGVLLSGRVLYFLQSTGLPQIPSLRIIFTMFF
jgi:hypothetical protein